MSYLLKKPQILWGWKRDRVEGRKVFPESRTIYFSSDLKLDKPYFFYETRAKKEEVAKLVKSLGNFENNDYRIQINVTQDEKYRNYSRLRLEIGKPRPYDEETINRRLRGKPRREIFAPRLIPPTKNYSLSPYTPFALCLGSGVSSESGLPLLGTIHNIFEVDDIKTGKLTFGAKDGIPQKVTHHPREMFQKFSEINLAAMKAKPSFSHKLIANLYHQKIIKQVFTDNIDNILAKVKVPYTQTRLSIFPDRFPVTFDKSVKSLLVIGVAVDRRDVIKQARRKGLKIIVINPVLGVAPHSRNMDYLKNGDIFFKEKACQALPKIIKSSKF